MCLAVPVLAGDPHAQAMKTKSGWFDMENCAFCKNLVKNPELLNHIQWENHATANGAVSITVVEPAYEAAYAEAMGAMEALGEQMHSGKVDPTKVKMCGHCAAYGQLMMAGVNMENVDGEAADVDAHDLRRSPGDRQDPRVHQPHQPGNGRADGCRSRALTTVERSTR